MSSAVLRLAAGPEERGRGLRAARRFLGARSPAATGSWVVFALFLAMAAVGPVLAPLDPTNQTASAFLPLGTEGHLLGTDELGRDTLSRIFHGARPLIMVSLFATLIACVVGVVCGLVAGFSGGWLDQALMRTTDIGLAFPSILIIILTVTVLGTNEGAMILGIGIAMAPNFARLARALAAREAAKDFVLAAKVSGSSAPRILAVEILPNMMGPILVQIVTTISIAAGFAAGLSYLGLGIQPPQPDWGYMVQAGQQFIYSDPRLVVIPALCTVAFVVACNFVGDDLRDTFDPRSGR